MARVDDALALASKGWSVFPCRDDKRPATAHGFKDASTDETAIRDWWRSDPEYLVGVAMPTSVLVVDIDDWDLFQSTGLALPETFMQQTRSGGWHAFYRLPEGVSPKQQVKRHPGVDTRVGGAGYVVMWDAESVIAAASSDDLPESPAWTTEDEAPRAVVSGSDEADFWVSSEGSTTRLDMLRMAGNMRKIGLTWESIAQVFAQERALGHIVDGDPERPWEPKDFIQIAQEAAKWDPAELVTEFTVQRRSPTVEAEIIETHEMIRPEPMGSDAFRGIAGQIVAAMRGKTEACDEALLMTFLAGMGALCGPERDVYLGGVQRANLFVSLVGPSSIGRKGTSYSVIRAILSIVDPMFNSVLLPGVESGQGLINALAKRQSAGPDYRTLLYEPEFGSLFSAINRDNSSLSATLRAAYDGSQLGRTVVGSSAAVDKHHVGVLGHVTPEELSVKMSDVEARNGFGNRFMWAWSERRIQLRKVPDPATIMQSFQVPVQQVLAHATTVHRQNVTDEAEELWSDISAESSGGRGLVSTLLARRPSHVARLALIYSLLDMLDTVELEHVQAAATVFDYSARTARAVFGDKTGYVIADALRRFLRDERHGEWTSLAVVRKETGMKYESVVHAVDVLKSEGLAQESQTRPGKSGGRPARLFRSSEV